MGTKAMIAGLALCATLAACGTTRIVYAPPTTRAEPTHEVWVQVVLLMPGGLSPSTQCLGSGQYAGVHGGAQVTIANESGTLLSVAPLLAEQSTTATDGSLLSCNWMATFPAIGSANVYAITVAGQQPYDFTPQQLFAKPQVNITYDENGGASYVAQT
jgi:hypothetical protein